MLFTMRMLVATVLCLCFAVPSPVLSFNSPEEKFAENQMAEAGEEGAEQNDINSIANTLIRQVLDAASERNMAVEEAAEEGDEMTLSKRTAGSNRPEREIRSRAQYQLGRRGNPVTSRSKFTFGKRSSSPTILRPTAKQILEELQQNADAENWRNREKLALLNDAAFYDNLQDNHQVQKDAYSAFSFGKRGKSAFSFGKRAMPSFAFGKRGMSSFAFGKRGLGGSAFAFGRRDWDPTEQDFPAAEESGPYEIKRADLRAFAFGKRGDQ